MWISYCQNTCNIDISVVDPGIREPGEGEGGEEETMRGCGFHVSGYK